MEHIPSSLCPSGKIYLNLDQQVNVYRYAEEINSLYRKLNDIETSVNQINFSLQDIEKMKAEVLARIEVLEKHVMELTPLPKSTEHKDFV